MSEISNSDHLLSDDPLKRAHSMRIWQWKSHWKVQPHWNICEYNRLIIETLLIMVMKMLLLQQIQIVYFPDIGLTYIDYLINLLKEMLRWGQPCMGVWLKKIDFHHCFVEWFNQLFCTMFVLERD